MKAAALYLLVAAGLMWVTWILYVAVMALKRARDSDTMSLPMKIMGYPWLYAGLMMDMLTNVVVCTVLFLELPREALVTLRLSRLIKGTGWRSRLAKWFCSNLLDPLDPSGCHCK